MAVWRQRFGTAAWRRRSRDKVPVSGFGDIGLARRAKVSGFGGIGLTAQANIPGLGDIGLTHQAHVPGLGGDRGHGMAVTAEVVGQPA
jgi:hypothetical protein